ncbi:hypothetical protein DSO57_1016260 [Entomophthora muscae]|uniref:Uncharacterized protein n=1 Tax=Entomophthora muscae TaxID=34485 RepID=A0ACC2TS09_9FUNG|nr:hypothetical protein DSO57_1016260 [Entomophthora muscae]
MSIPLLSLLRLNLLWSDHHLLLLVILRGRLLSVGALVPDGKICLPGTLGHLAMITWVPDSKPLPADDLKDMWAATQKTKTTTRQQAAQEAQALPQPISDPQIAALTELMAELQKGDVDLDLEDAVRNPSAWKHTTQKAYGHRWVQPGD